ncbi:MAG: hypothetical protein IJQ78_05925 [Selenomonadaceae bacterium]|nr:hypothetical protein [Selenomonadaceae bacterium]
MKEISLDRELEAFDFSQIHPVREELLDRLLMMQRSRNHGGDLRSRLQAARLVEEELDWVAAARGIEQDPDSDR